MSPEAIAAQIEARGLQVGNQVKDSAGNVGTTLSKPMYADSAGILQAGNIPFAIPLMAGVTSTAASVASVEGSSTGTANDLMHLTLVKASNVTTFTSQAFLRIDVTDDAGNITNGSYYLQVGTLS